MRIFLVEHNVAVEQIVKPASSLRLDRISDLNYSALALDQIIFGGRQNFDWVLFAQTEDIKFTEFCTVANFIPMDSKTILTTHKNSLENNSIFSIFKCFYCRPAVYSLIGSHWKTKDDFRLFLAKQRIDIQSI